MNPPPRTAIDDDWIDRLETAVVVVDGFGGPGIFNAAAEELLGVARNSPGAPDLVRRVLDESGVNALIAQARRENRDISATGIRWRRGDRELWLDVHVGTLPDGEALLELHDASLRRAAQAEARRHERRVLSRRVARQLAHEIRNPLAGLHGAAQLLERDEPDPQRRELAAIVQREVARLQRLVERVLGPAGRPDMRPGNIHTPVDHVRALLQAEAGDRTRIVRDYDPSLPEVEFDADGIEQILLNLGRNAVQAGAGEVVLRTRIARNATWGGERHRLAIAVEVVDDGPGVPEDLAESLFFPFVTGRADGTGFGLALAQELADRHGGNIDFDSRPGQTVFRLLLPVPE